jgi:YbbR domain-containing protein
VSRATGSNLHLKLLSFTLTLTLFFFVLAENRKTRVYRVGVDIHDIPSGWVLMEQPGDVRVSVQGTARSFSRLDPESLRTVEIGPIQPGQRTWDLRVEDFGLPPGLQVVDMEPEQVTLSLDEIAERELPINVNLRGRLPDGLELLAAFVEPESITVSAPRSYFPEFDEVFTEALDLSSVSGPVRRRVGLALQRQFVSYDRTSEIVVTVDVGLVEAERTLEIPIQIVGSGGCTADDLIASLSFRGPDRIVASADTLGIFATVDCNALAARGAGVYVEAPTVRNLPASIEIVNLVPREIRVTVPPALAVEGSGTPLP